MLNPKSIKAINDEENFSLIAAVAELKGGGGGIPGGGLNDNESVLTQDNIREFENSVHFDEDGLNDFIPGKEGAEGQVARKEDKKEGYEDYDYDEDEKIKKKKPEGSDAESLEAGSGDDHEDAEDGASGTLRIIID